MSQDEAARYLTELGEAFPDTRPPTSDLLTSGRAARRRRNRRRMLVATAASVLALSAGAVVQQAVAGNDGGGPDRVAPADGTEPDHVAAADVPPAPDGKRLVGMGRVVVAVPTSWVNWQPSCGEPDGGYVYFEPVAAIGCIPQTPDNKVVPSLGIADSTTPESRELVRNMNPGESIQGLATVQDDPACPDTLGGACTQRFAVPDAGVLFTVRFLNTSGVLTTTFADIRDSVSLLPDGVTTVPHRDDHLGGSTGVAVLVGEMRSAGLEVAVVAEPQVDTPDGVLLSIDPSPGSVIRIGATVTLTVTGGSAGPTLIDPTASAPPRPAPITMETVRRVASAQEFRPYTGPTPAPFSEREALHRERAADAYSLGLWDVGMVNEDTTVEWTPVWIVASEYLVDDLNQLSLGGRAGVTPSPPPARPGWGRSFDMYDARTGTFVLGVGF